MCASNVGHGFWTSLLKCKCVYWFLILHSISYISISEVMQNVFILEECFGISKVIQHLTLYTFYSMLMVCDPYFVITLLSQSKSYLMNFKVNYIFNYIPQAKKRYFKIRLQSYIWQTCSMTTCFKIQVGFFLFALIKWR